MPGRRSDTGRSGRCLAALASIGCALVFAAAAGATAKDRISVSAPATATDGAQASVVVAGTAAVTAPAVYATRKPAAHASCAPEPRGDSGVPLSGLYPASVSSGSFSSTRSVPLGAGENGEIDDAPPGRYLLCAWLMASSQSNAKPLAKPASATVALIAPTGTLDFSPLHELVGIGQRLGIQTTFTTSATDLTLAVDVKPLPAHGPVCAPTRAGDTGVVQVVVARKPAVRSTTMIRLARAGVYVACARLEWPHGTVDGPFVARVVVAARHQRAAAYLGATDQRLPRSKTQSSYPIEFATIDGQLVNLYYYARFTCKRDGKPTTHPIYSTSFPVFGIGVGGRFADSFTFGNDHASITGRLRGGRASGSFSETYTTKDGYSCRSGSVAFNARRA